jgi:hypothetical protein
LLVLCGVLLGVPCVMSGGRLVSSLFFGISPHAWATFLGATITLIGVGSPAASFQLYAHRESTRWLRSDKNDQLNSGGRLGVYCLDRNS